MHKAIAILAVSIALSGCGVARQIHDRAEFHRQMHADAASCRTGSKGACMAYMIDVKRCGVLGSYDCEE